jgi:hypothetical protein
VVGDGVAAVERKELRLISRGLRPGEDRPVVVIEQFDRRRANHAEKIVGRARDQMDLRIGAFPADIAVEAGDPRRRLVTPAVILDPLRSKVEAPFSIPDAVLQPTAEATVGAARGVEFRAAIGEAVLHLKADGAAERVETEGWVIGPDVGTPDSNVRDEIPVDGVAEGFVDAHTLHVDREPLRCALQGRGSEAAITQIRSELVALRVAYEHAWNALIQRLGHVWRIDARKVFGGERLNHGRHFVAI